MPGVHKDQLGPRMLSAASSRSAADRAADALCRVDQWPQSEIVISLYTASNQLLRLFSTLTACRQPATSFAPL
jgi:hypothetical protein